MVLGAHGLGMVKLDENESVRRNGESFSIGDKVYSQGQAKFGVGYIQEIEVLGVSFGFRAKINSTNLDEPEWFDARSMTHEAPLTNQDLIL